MLNRTIPPEINEIQRLDLPKPQRHVLDNGIQVLETRMGTQEILKLELCFDAGRPFEQKQLASRATGAMLREGTASMNAAEIAERFDFHGGTFTIPVSLDTTTITLYSLHRHFEALLPMIAEMVTQPTMPEKEFLQFKERRLQRLQVDLSRNDVIAYRMITENIFGVDHPYGYNSYPETYHALQREDLFTHFKNNYTAANCRIFISGWTDDRTIAILNTYLGKGLEVGSPNKVIFDYAPQSPEKIRVDHPNTVQTAIRIGRKLFGRNHPDYMGMYVLNTILGGYFGSRLMANVREDKGFTYNIFSGLDPMVHDGYFYIGTEVGTDYVKPALDEIYREIKILQEDLVGDEEFEMVRNYLLGNLLTMLDGPFNVSEVIRTFEIDQLNYDFFTNLAETVRTISPEEIRKLAQKYLQPADMWEVIVG